MRQSGALWQHARKYIQQLAALHGAQRNVAGMGLQSVHACTSLVAYHEPMLQGWACTAGMQCCMCPAERCQDGPAKCACMHIPAYTTNGHCWNGPAKHTCTYPVLHRHNHAVTLCTSV
eukprot:1161263-Pelagomonas_calceolata.AAC.14